MAVSIHKLIAAINPDVYCKTDPDKDKDPREKVKKIVKEALAKKSKTAYLDGAKEAMPKEGGFSDPDQITYNDPFDLKGIKDPIERHVLEYEALGESIEKVYFWLFDKMSEEFKETKKIIDNFTASPGSGFFSEMGNKATAMQNQAMSTLGALNQVVKTILSLIYNIKEMKLYLEPYDRYKSDDKNERESGRLSLKQKWLDAVDIKRGTTSIKQLAFSQSEFITLIDAFFKADSIEDAKKLDLNERVKRILEQRIPEFEFWIKESEAQLRKRFEIEKQYLKSQASTIKLYARWVKPYLKAAKALEQKTEGDAELVSVFDTAIFELMLLGQGEYDPLKDPMLPKKLFDGATNKKYVPLLLINLKFRSRPERFGQRGDYSFRGRATMEFTSYVLTEDELKILKEQLERDDLNDAFAEVKTDVDELLGEVEEKPEEEKKKEETSDENPFTALFSFITKKKKEEKVDLSKGIPKDTDLEKVIRSQALMQARKACWDFYEKYKKLHDMPTFPSVYSI
jgi:hypothetical protein